MKVKYRFDQMDNASLYDGDNEILVVNGMAEIDPTEALKLLAESHGGMLVEAKPEPEPEPEPRKKRAAKKSGGR